jgi:hypothetical protein
MVVPCSSRISLISAWLGLTNGLNDPVVRKVWFADPRRDVPGIDSMLVFRPLLGLVFHHLSYLLGSTTCGMFRLYGENPKLS